MPEFFGKFEIILSIYLLIISSLSIFKFYDFKWIGIGMLVDKSIVIIESIENGDDIYVAIKK